MKHDPIIGPAGRSLKTRTPLWRRAVAIAGKLLVGLLVFVGIVTGWLWWEIEADRRAPLPDPALPQGTCALWFVGSSSMHKWITLTPDMRPWIAHNRGVNGAGINYLAGRFSAQDRATPAPSAIVLYGGENDIAVGTSVADTLNGVRRLIRLKTEMYGALPVFLLSIKPSPTRWRFLPQQTQLNAALRRMAANRADLHYVDIVPQMLVNGRPGPWYQADGIHLNRTGYRRWAKVLHGALAHDLPARTVARCAR
ncbi:Lysophospholipase L1 [Sphingomonas gellani]|uniref:Lysophospholipase L1 n=1 Tax=Sphingomonas gellani TaxID=1166340 RepID=A0A1H8EDS1_9SPHN|nr:GDSL-type esterase/lipase family protein [Sphingomonas gellani]SEN17520.1 Lysophospholipase L1 [Sphingomonas gellani]